MKRLSILKFTSLISFSLWCSIASAQVPLAAQEHVLAMTSSYEVSQIGEKWFLGNLFNEKKTSIKQSKEILDRIIDGFQMERDISQPAVQKRIRWYQKHKRHLRRVLYRAQPYMRHILGQLEAKNMPTEILLLPILESAYDPFAYSYQRASGLWQIIPNTAEHLGLKHNWWYDGSRDVYTSTQAAIEYLSYLYSRFGDWHLALAAYNGGEGKVSNAMWKNKAKKKPTDFWSLRLPKETRAYVPHLIALAEIFAHAEKYSIQLLDLEQSPTLEIIDIDDQIDLTYVANASDLTLKDVYTYNPGFNRWATPPEGPHHILLPIDNTESFNRALKELPSARSTIRWQRYRVKEGDSLIQIAKLYKTTPKHLRAINDLKKNALKENDYLFVPVASKESTVLLEETPVLSHVIVKKGHTLWDIGKENNVTIKQLTEWNDISKNQLLKIGQKLTLYSVPDFKQKTPFLALDKAQLIRKIQYRVRKGDSILAIADKFNISPKKIRRWNALSDNAVIHPGDRLALRVDVTQLSENL